MEEDKNTLGLHPEVREEDRVAKAVACLLYTSCPVRLGETPSRIPSGANRSMRLAGWVE